MKTRRKLLWVLLALMLFMCAAPQAVFGDESDPGSIEEAPSIGWISAYTPLFRVEIHGTGFLEENISGTLGEETLTIESAKEYDTGIHTSRIYILIDTSEAMEASYGAVEELINAFRQSDVVGDEDEFCLVVDGREKFKGSNTDQLMALIHGSVRDSAFQKEESQVFSDLMRICQNAQAQESGFDREYVLLFTANDNRISPDGVDLFDIREGLASHVLPVYAFVSSVVEDGVYEALATTARSSGGRAVMIDSGNGADADNDEKLEEITDFIGRSTLLTMSCGAGPRNDRLKLEISLGDKTVTAENLQVNQQTGKAGTDARDEGADAQSLGNTSGPEDTEGLADDTPQPTSRPSAFRGKESSIGLIVILGIVIIGAIALFVILMNAPGRRIPAARGGDRPKRTEISVNTPKQAPVNSAPGKPAAVPLAQKPAASYSAGRQHTLAADPDTGVKPAAEKSARMPEQAGKDSAARRGSERRIGASKRFGNKQPLSVRLEVSSLDIPTATRDKKIPAAGEITVGRSEGCDIVVNDRKLSRRHLALVNRDGEVWVKDCGSTNGTILNGRRLIQSEKIQPNDTIMAGLTKIKIIRIM